MPLFNALATPRLRTVAVIDYEGKRWVWAPWGEVDWVKNLRASGRATVAIRHRDQQVSARELNEDERRIFFRDVMGAQARRLPGGFWFFRLADGVDLHHPDEIAKDRRVFELTNA